MLKEIKTKLPDIGGILGYAVILIQGIFTISIPYDDLKLFVEYICLGDG